MDDRPRGSASIYLSATTKRLMLFLTLIFSLMLKGGIQLSEERGQGVTITLREIYDTLNGLDSSVKRLEQRIIRLEEKTSLAEEEKREIKKVWLSAFLSSAIPWILTIFAGLIYLSQKGGL